MKSLIRIILCIITAVIIACDLPPAKKDEPAPVSKPRQSVKNALNNKKQTLIFWPSAFPQNSTELTPDIKRQLNDLITIAREERIDLKLVCGNWDKNDENKTLAFERAKLVAQYIRYNCSSLFNPDHSLSAPPIVNGNTNTANIILYAGTESQYAMDGISVQKKESPGTNKFRATGLIALSNYQTGTAPLPNEITASGNSLNILQEKINEVVSLKTTLEEKRTDMIKTRLEYETDVTQLKVEIDNERKSSQIDSYAQALKNKRVRNNLALIQRQSAYVDKISQLEQKILQGIEELLYLEREAKADLKMVKLLDNKDELVQRIDRSLQNYSSSSAKFAIEAKQLKFKPLKQIWQEIAPPPEEKLPQKPMQESGNVLKQ